MPDQRLLAPRTLQTFGMVLLVIFVSFWMATGRESILLVGVAASMILIGRYERTKEAVRQLTVRPGES